MRSIAIVFALSLSSSLLGCIDDTQEGGEITDPGSLGKGDNDDEGGQTPPRPTDLSACHQVPGQQKPGPQFCPPVNSLNAVPKR